MISALLILTRRERWFVLILFVGAFLLRVLYLFEISHQPLFTYLVLDAEFHDSWAQSIANGNVLGNSVFFRAPLYPYFLGCIYWVAGHNDFVARVVQHVLGSAGVVVLYYIARRLFGSNVAVISSLLYAAYPVVLYLEDQLLLESIINVQVLTLFAIVVYEHDRPSIGRWIVIGVVLGFACITRPTFLPVYVLLLGYLWAAPRTTMSGRKAVLCAMGLTGGLILVIAPIAVRNYVVGKDIVLIASQGGVNFYIGNNPSADGSSSQIPGDAGLRWGYRDVEYPVAKLLGRSPKPSEVSSYWYARGLEFVVQQPAASIGLFAKKLYLFWNRFELPNNQSFYSFAAYSYILRWIPVGFWCVGPLGLLGMFMARNIRTARLVAMFIILYSVVVILFFVCDRFRLPVIPFLCMFSGLALSTLWQAFREKRLRSMRVYLAAFFALAIFTNSNLLDLRRDYHQNDLFHLGNAALEQGNYKLAISYFDECDLLPGRLRDVSLNRGVAEWKLGNAGSTVINFHRELTNFPRSADAMANIARVYLLKGVNESTLVYARRALEIRPFASSVYVDFALACVNLQELGRAESVLVRGRINSTSDFSYGESVLAGVHLMQGKADVAEREYRSVLESLMPNQQPDYKPEFQFSKSYELGDEMEHFKAKIYYSLGHTFAERSVADSAVQYFQKATDAWHDFPEAWIDLGNSLHDMKRLDESEVAFRSGLKLNPNNFMGWYNYGLLLAEVGKNSLASSAFKNALRINPDFSPAREALTMFDN